MKRARGWLITALLVWMPSVLCAQEVESNEQHEVLFRRAVEALRLSQYEVASISFEESLRIRPQAKTACNLALTYDRWGGHEVPARDAYVRCAELDQAGRFRDHALARAGALREVIANRPPEDLPDPVLDVPDPVDDYQPRPVQPQPVLPPTRGLLWAGVAFTVAGVAALGSGIAPSISASADSDTILDKYPNRRIAPDDDTYLRLNDDFNRKGRLALGLYVAGGAVVLVGAAFIIADVVRHRRRTPPTARVGVAPTEGGAMAVGRFEF